MRNEEQLLGFDVRAMWSQMDVTWPESRKARFLLRANVTKVLSVDTLVWARALPGVEKNVRAPTQWRDLGLWESLHHLRKYLQQNAGAIARPYQVIGITLLRDTLAEPEQEMWASLATPVPASLRKEWKFLGYDVADDSFISSLSDCAYEADELQLRTGWELVLNEWHLFTQRRQAIKFQKMSDQRVDEHAPFCIYGLYSLLQSGADT
jgi:hypothetical protein